MFEAGQIVAVAKVRGGAQSTVALVGSGPIQVVGSRGAGGQGLAQKVVYEGPLQAPVRNGDRVATLQITREGAVVREVPLVAGAHVGEGSLIQRAWQMAWDEAISLVNRHVKAF